MTRRKRLTRAEAKEATRRKVLAAAAKVFQDRGYHSATLDEVADIAGYSKGAIYSSFATKDDLFLALLDERVARADEQWRFVLGSDGSDEESAPAWPMNSETPGSEAAWNI